MANPYVFISYSRPDRQFVEKLVGRLRNAGIITWTDLDNILPGQEWAHEIEQGVLKASALIYVASRNSTASQWIVREINFALDKELRVIPVVLDDEGAERMPSPLKDIQWVDCRGPFEPALDSLLAGIRRLQVSGPVEATKIRGQKGYVFISYADEDSAFVTDLKSFMKSKGYGYWDFRESNCDYQADYTLELENVIKDAAGTLSVVSPQWKRSRTALQELHFSWEVGTPVFSFKVKDPDRHWRSLA